MSFIFHTGAASTAGVTVATAAEAMFLYKELLKAAGWEVQASSDGTNVSNTPGNANDQISSAAEMNVNNAWYVIKQPTVARGWGRNGGRQIIVRRGTSATTWLIVYVPLDSNDVAQTPTAAGTTTTIPVFTTRFALHGTLPDTAASFLSSLSGTRILIGAMNTPPYGNFFGGWSSTGASPGGLILFDPLEPDSIEPEDEDPYVVGAFATNAWEYQGLSSTTTGPYAYWRRNYTGEKFSNIAAAYYAVWRPSADLLAIPGDVGRSPIARIEKPLPVWYMRPGTNGSDVYTGVGVKGASSIWTWKMGGYHSGTLLTHKDPGDRIVMADAVVPWPTGTNPNWGT